MGGNLRDSGFAMRKTLGTRGLEPIRHPEFVLRNGFFHSLRVEAPCALLTSRRSRARWPTRMTQHPVIGRLAMRTMRSLAAVVILSGMLLFPSRSAQACHGKTCSLCSGRGYSGASGFAGYGYGLGYGYGPIYSYMPASNYGSGYGWPPWYCPPRPPLTDSYEGETSTGRRGSVNARLTELEDRVAAYETYANTRLDNLQAGLN